MLHPLVDVAVAGAAAATAALLACTGLLKAAPRATHPTPPEAIAAFLGGEPRARRALRAVGVLELAVAAALVGLPPSAAGVATGALGLGFLGYLPWARSIAPHSGCGCAGRAVRVTWRTYARAAAVAATGVATVSLAAPWWQVTAARPGGFAVAAAAGLCGYLAVSPEADDRWLLPTRKLRLRLLGHPLAAPEEPVPLAASVELLESSLAWWSAAHLVRSGLLEHWLADGWRILRYTGRHETPDGSRAVSVVFALDAHATTCASRETAIRATVVDEGTGQVLTEALRRAPDPAGISSKG